MCKAWERVREEGGCRKKEEACWEINVSSTCFNSFTSCVSVDAKGCRRAAQLQKLESKLDHLVNALSSSTSQFSAISSSSPQTIAPTRSIEFSQPSPAFSPATNQASSTSRTDDVLNTLCAGDHEQVSKAWLGSNAPHADMRIKFDTSKNTQPVEPVCISLQEAEVLLDRYKRLMASYMPFVVLPPDSTATSLYKISPLLLRAILTVALFHDMSKQRWCIKDLVREVGERIMVKAERSVDILQCVIIIVAWYHPHTFWFNQITMLLHMAIALTVDTGIDRPTQKSDPLRRNATRTHNLADHRVLLGVYYYTSVMATNFGNKMDALAHTLYMDQCLSNIEAAREYDSDLHLIQAVRIQHLISTIASTSTSHVPNRVFAAAFRADIDKLVQVKSTSRQTLPHENLDLKLQYLAANLHAHEVSISDLFENHTKLLTSHLEDVYACLSDIQAIFDVFSAVPPSHYFLVTFSVFDHFVYALITFTKLALIEADPYIRNALDEKMRFSLTFETFAAAFEGSAQSTPDGMPVENDCFSAWAKKLRFATQVWEAKMMHHRTRSASPSAGEKVGNEDRLTRTLNEMGQVTPAESLDSNNAVSADFFSYLDGNFWDSFAGDFDFGYMGADAFGS
jgi:hypothetical protein